MSQIGFVSKDPLKAKSVSVYTGCLYFFEKELWEFLEVKMKLKVSGQPNMCTPPPIVKVDRGVKMYVRLHKLLLH